MRAALEVCRRWEAEGKAVAAATLVAVAGSAPRREGARLLVSSAGDTWGSVSNGCVEGDLAAHAADVLRSGRPRLAAYGIADEQAFAVGLSCGGEIEVFIEPWAGLDARLGGGPGEEFVGALATVVAGPGEGDHGLFDRELGLVAGDLPDCLAAAAGGRRTGRGGRRAEPVGGLRGVASVRGDAGPRPPPAAVRGGAHCRGPHPCGGGRGLPGDGVRSPGRPGPARSATRRPPACWWAGPTRWCRAWSSTAAATPWCSPTTPASRCPCCPCCSPPRPATSGSSAAAAPTLPDWQRLAAEGWGPEQVARLHGPIGLDIGAANPEEVAVAIVAQMVAARRGRLGTGGAAGA